MSVTQNLEREFDAIDEYFKAVSAILRDGHMPDLSGLDKRVGDLCMTIQSVEPEVQQQFIVKMNGLLQKLDQCEKEIRHFHEAKTEKHA